MTEQRYPSITVVGRAIRTGISVEANDLIGISATGQVDFGGAVFGLGAPILDADGDTYHTPPDYPAPELRKNSLIVGVRNRDHPHTIHWRQGGSNRSFRSPVSGTLVLAANDATPDDNSRGWNVVLTVTSPDRSGGSPLLAVGRIEVVQSIQRTDNSVPLVAGKRTLVRLFANSGRTDNISVPVEADLRVTFSDRSVWTGRATGAALREGSHDRDSLESSLNFIVPAPVVGAADLQVELRAAGASPDLPGNRAEGRTRVTFGRAPVIAIRPFLIELRVEGLPAPSWAAASSVLYDMQQRLPMIEGANILPPQPLTWISPMSWEGILLVLMGWSRPNIRLPGERDHVHLGFLTLPPGSTRGGFAVYNPFPATAISGIGGDAAFDVETCAHEVGHALGLNHVADCGAGIPWSSRLPRRTEEPGWYARESRMVPAGSAEMMSYCPTRWPSITAYRYVLDGRHS